MGINNPSAGIVYGEGSFTPRIGGSTTLGNQTYSIQDGRYIQIGNLINFWGRTQVSAVDPSIAGYLIITGLPFIATTEPDFNFTIGAFVISGISFSSGFTQLSGAVLGGTTQIQFAQNGSGVVSTTIPVTNLASTFDVRFSGTYRIN